LLYLDDLSPELLYTTIPMHPFDRCKRDMQGLITDKLVCGGGSGNDTCQGNIWANKKIMVVILATLALDVLALHTKFAKIAN